MSASNERDPEVVRADADEPGLFWVAAYLENRIFGGPEEGGWYFDRGTLVTDPEVYGTLQAFPAGFPTREAAAAHAERMRGGLAVLNAGRRPTWSVLSTGIYVVETIKALTLPPYHPEHWQTYE